MVNGESKRTCFKCGCSPSADNVKLFRFPKPAVWNLVRCELWAKYIFPDRDSTIEMQRKLHSEHRMLCQKHFNDDDFTDDSKKLLLRNAVPSDISREDSAIEQDNTPVQDDSSNEETCQSALQGTPEPETAPNVRDTPQIRKLKLSLTRAHETIKRLRKSNRKLSKKVLTMEKYILLHSEERLADEDFF